MKAIQISQDSSNPITLVDIDRPEIKKNQVLVKIEAAALNRRDQWIREGLYPGIKPGVTLGSDGTGQVVEGPEHLRDKRVIINPNVNWGKDEKVQSGDYSILGLPTDGTFAEFIAVDQDKVFEAPAHLAEKEAAALPLAGMTAYRALFTRGEVQKGDDVLITGAGGGVSQFAVLFAIAAGARVFVTSGKNEKIEACKKLGVINGFNYKDKEWVSKARSNARAGFDAIIDSAGGDSLNDYLKLIKPGGNIVHYGATTGKPSNLDLFRLFWSQANIKGSTMASDEEFGDMVSFVKEHKIIPSVDSVFNLIDYIEAFDRIKSPDHMGKVVITF